jgi:hypothetical protein
MQKGKIILTVPTSALRTPLNLPKSIARPIAEKAKTAPTSHCLLAAELSIDTTARPLWRAVLPTREDFKSSMPITWSSGLQELLPRPFASDLLENQKRKFELDLANVTAAFPSLDKKDYVYAWLLVNTRTFYYVPPGAKKPKNPDDGMALNPFADYFNHSSVGCSVIYSPRGFDIATDRVYEKGEEVYISYGRHSNDFLLAEYGFVMENNSWDAVGLDEVILPKLSREQKERLEEEGFLGKYVLDKDGLDWRAEVAITIMCVNDRKWRLFLSGEESTPSDQARVDELVIELLEEYFQKAEETVKILNHWDENEKEQALLLRKRWEQIADTLEATIKALST